MSRWEPNARGRLEQAALDLFAERGFEQTTAAEIAERAGLTKRTFFRHFADKREVLFGGGAELQAIFVDNLAGAPPSAAPIDALAASLEAAGAMLQERHAFARRRQAVIVANPELQERELVKLATIAAALAATLRERGVAEPAASLAAEAAIAAFKVGFERWVADGNERGARRPDPGLPGPTARDNRQCRDRQRLPRCRQEALLWIANPCAVALAAQGAIMATSVRVRAITNEEGNRLLRIVRRSSGSVVTWRRAQMVLLSAQGMDAARIAEVTFTSPDRVRDVIHNFNADGFDALYPRYRGGRPPTFTLPERHEIKRIALSRPATTTCRFRPGAWPSWPTSWSPRGWSRTSAMRGCARCCASRVCPSTPRRRGSAASAPLKVGLRRGRPAWKLRELDPPPLSPIALARAMSVPLAA